ncbi:neuronal-specific septin-3-like isoform X1 [Conger conger]|uniref:neuronal-specific septin-3-like isoform X1 n=2 Tax=Conger conger TaxID=82655 RepID=UPI002A5ADCFE|nr:neuronal-specific septin-3-like isoform X1 [Conger conger]
MKRTGYTGLARTSSGRLRRTEPFSPSIPTLKRSFEVEEVDAHPALHTRRTTSLRSTFSPSSRFQDLGARNSDAAGRVAGEALGLRRAELGGGRITEPVPRRSEISIDISSKHVDTSAGAGISRFGLKRPDILSHGRNADPSLRRAELAAARSQEPPAPPRRADPPASLSRTADPPASVSRTADAPQRRAEPPSPVEAPSRRLETLLGNNGVAPPTAAPDAAATPNHTEPKAEPPAPAPEVIAAADRSEVIPSYSSTMSESVKPAAPPAAPACPEVPSVDFSYVGIDAILEQMRRKAMKQGFELNIMVVGQSGLGKSTLMNTLFKSKVSRRSVVSTSEERIPKTIEIKSISHDIEEKGVRMKLTVIDTPGFGDQINNENCWQPIMKFINEQYEQYLQEEINIERKKRIPDSRVHCCIYFIPPTGHSLRPLDVEFMRRLSKVVNIVPVIAKADTLTLEERDFFKMKIREELRVNGIDVYPQKEFDEDTEDRMINEKIREMIPFAVVGSDQEYQVNGRRILGRKTKWGTIEVENIGHCEFAYLRDLLIRTHMQNIKDITSSIHYEVYRVRRLNEGNAQTNGVAQHHASAHEM